MSPPGVLTSSESPAAPGPAALPVVVGVRGAERPAGPRAPSLSPSRASDFLGCPLRYRFRVVDRLPEPAHPAAVRGTVVHAVLERLFDLPPAERTLERARTLLAPAWEQVRVDDPRAAELADSDRRAFDGVGVAATGAGGGSAGIGSGETDLPAWLEGAGDLLATYFGLEDPGAVEPAERELRVETVVDGGLTLRGFVDRLDVAADGAIRIVDYKTGRSPGEGFEARALFQMRFYALVVWRLRGVLPRLLQLMYLGDGTVVRYAPDEAELLATERKVRAVWAAVEDSMARHDFRPNPGRLCDWCDHKVRCPAFGGVAPPYPSPQETDPGPANGSSADGSPASSSGDLGGNDPGGYGLGRTSGDSIDAAEVVTELDLQ